MFVYACVWLTDSEGETEAGEKKHREGFNSSMLITSTSSQMAEGSVLNLYSPPY